MAAVETQSGNMLRGWAIQYIRKARFEFKPQVPLRSIHPSILFFWLYAPIPNRTCIFTQKSGTNFFHTDFVKMHQSAGAKLVGGS